MPSLRSPCLRASMGLLGLLASAALSAAALAGCGAAQSITPKRVVFEPTIVACSGNPPDCASGGKSLARRVREARTHRCPRDESILLAKSDGTFVCVARVPTAGPPLIGAAPPRSVRAGGTKAVAEFTAGEAVATTSGCLACHRIAGAGNEGPGRPLTHVGSRLPATAIERALVASPAPMPSFSRIPRSQRDALVYFLAHLH